jgi:formate dehydrogenase
MRALGGSKLYSPMHVDIAPKCVASETIYGHPTTHSFPDIERCDFLLMLGANPAISKMSLICEPRALERLDAISRRRGVVVVDPRRTETARRYEHIPIVPDTDAWLLGAMLGEIFRRGWVDQAMLDARVAGWRNLRDAVLDFSLEEASQRCGIAVGTIAEITKRFLEAPRAACYGRVGTNRGRFSTPTNLFIEALNIVTGRFGHPGGLVIGKSQLAPWFNRPGPAYGSQLSRTGKLPMVKGNQPGACLAADILDEGEGQIRALIIDGANPVLTMPDSNRLEAALQTLELLIGIDLYVNESNKHAHYVLPATASFERWDLNERWVQSMPRPLLQHTDAIVEPAGEARHEYQIFEDLRRRLGLPTSFAGMLGEDSAPDLRAMADDAIRSGPLGDHYGANPDGLTIDKLADQFQHGFVVASNVDAEASWDCVLVEGGKPRLWNDLIESEIARVKADPVETRGVHLKLIGRRNLKSYNSWMHNNQRLVRSDTPTLLMNPADAAERKIPDASKVEVTSATATVQMQVELTDDIVRGAVSYPHGWGHAAGWRVANAKGGANVNALASSDPKDWEFVSATPLLDGIPVIVKPLVAADAGFV